MCFSVIEKSLLCKPSFEALVDKLINWVSLVTHTQLLDEGEAVECIGCCPSPNQEPVRGRVPRVPVQRHGSSGHGRPGVASQSPPAENGPDLLLAPGRGHGAAAGPADVAAGADPGRHQARDHPVRGDPARAAGARHRQVGCDWRKAGHVTSILILDWLQVWGGEHGLRGELGGGGGHGHGAAHPLDPRPRRQLLHGLQHAVLVRPAEAPLQVVPTVAS